MDIIIPNTLQSTTAFIKFIRDEQDQLEFVTPILSFFLGEGVSQFVTCLQIPFDCEQKTYC